MSEAIQVSPLKLFTGELAVPGDKSISHRAAILAGLSDGSCFVENFLPSEDCVNTLRAMAPLGVSYEVKKGTDDLPVDLVIHGCGGGLQAPAAELRVKETDRIETTACVATSYPTFSEHLQAFCNR